MEEYNIRELRVIVKALSTLGHAMSGMLAGRSQNTLLEAIRKTRLNIEVLKSQK